MGENQEVMIGIKYFVITDISEGFYRWFLLSERSNLFTSKIKIDENNLWRVCENLQQVSMGAGNLYKRWGRKQQNLLHRVYQNYNAYWRFIHSSNGMVKGNPLS